MKINYNRKFNKLPNLIENCSSTVYIIFDNDHKLAINQNPDILDFFRGTCESARGNMELNLEFSNPHDMSNILNYLVSA